MSTDDTDDPFWRSYDIGYGKPPPSGRFVKGRSGNPRGRPKTTLAKSRPPNPRFDQSSRDRFLAEADRPVSIRDGDKLEKIPMVDAITRAQSLAALKGSSHAQKNFLERDARYREDLAAEISQDHEFWKDYVEKVSD